MFSTFQRPTRHKRLHTLGVILNEQVGEIPRETQRQNLFTG